jgi:hypothetical protein
VSLRRDDAGAIILEGNCPVEDAEPLLQMLQATSTATLDWSRCGHLHTAVLQLILAARIAPAGPCGDPWVRQWAAPDAPGQAPRIAPAPDRSACSQSHHVLAKRPPNDDL